MNISRAVSQILLMHGLNQITLPFKSKIENIVYEVFKTITIPEYSQFVPLNREGTYNLASMKVVDKRANIYLLPEELTPTPVMWVVDVKLPISVNRGMYGDIATPFGVSRSIQGVLAHQAYMMLIGAARSEPTFEYLNENKIRLYGFPKTWISFEVASEHDENAESIPATCYDSFMQLATLDFRSFLYHNLKLYSDISTLFGTINLKIDEFQGADADRTALLESWRDSWHVDQATAWKWF